MFSSTPAKSFLLFFALALSFSACGWWQKPADTSNSSPAPFAAREIPSEIPFQTREPENFQAETVVSIFSGAEKIERRSFVARSGAARLTRFAVGEPAETARLETADGKTLLLDPARKIYAETTAASPSAATVEGESLQSYLTTEWLNAKTGATFENQGADGGLTKFLVRLNHADTNEILIFYDEAAKIVVKQEFYARRGEERFLFYSFELRNLKLEADAGLFEAPKNFAKVSLKEFEQSAWQEKQ